MKPIYRTIESVDDTTGIATSQSITNGLFFTLGAATLVANFDIQSQQVTATSSASNTGNLVYIGADVFGNVVTETTAAPSTGSPVTTTKFFTSMTSVQAIDDNAGLVFIGWDGERGDAITQPLPVNWRQGPANITLGMEPFPNAALDPSLSLATMQYSLDDPEDTVNFPSYNNDAAWRSPITLVQDAPNEDLGLSIAADTRLDGPVRAIRGVIQGTIGGEGTQWRYTIIQGNTN